MNTSSATTTTTCSSDPTWESPNGGTSALVLLLGTPAVLLGLFLFLSAIALGALSSPELQKVAFLAFAATCAYLLRLFFGLLAIGSGISAARERRVWIQTAGLNFLMFLGSMFLLISTSANFLGSLVFIMPILLVLSLAGSLVALTNLP